MTTITAEFVTDARAHYVSAMSWLRANGWAWGDAGFRNKTRKLSIEWATTPVAYITVNVRTESGKYLRCPLMADVDSCRQAVDYLVTAGVLPVEFHSLAVAFTELTADDLAEADALLAPAGGLAGLAEYVNTTPCRATWYGARCTYPAVDGDTACEHHTIKPSASVTP